MKKIDFVNAQQPAINDVNLYQMQLNIENAINAQVSGDTLPVGAIIPYSSDSVPENWLLANGQEVSRADYEMLFSIIGTTYGDGDGSTTFNLPNLCGKVAAGKDTTDTDFNELGKTGGEKTHTLTIDEMPAHTHNYYYKNIGSATGADSLLANSNNADGSVPTESQGANKAHNNLQPYIVQNYIIKTKQSAGLVATVVDNLESESETDALSARQGKILNYKIDEFKKVIWEDEEVVKTTVGSNVTLTNMPNLNEYIGKTINLYFRYANDALTKYSVIITDESSGFYYLHTRNHSGNDIWFINLNFNNIKSNAWLVGTCVSNILNNDNTLRIDNENNNLYLCKIEVEN